MGLRSSLLSLLLSCVLCPVRIRPRVRLLRLRTPLQSTHVNTLPVRVRPRLPPDREQPLRPAPHDVQDARVHPRPRDSVKNKEIHIPSPSCRSTLQLRFRHPRAHSPSKLERVRLRSRQVPVSLTRGTAAQPHPAPASAALTIKGADPHTAARPWMLDGRWDTPQLQPAPD